MAPQVLFIPRQEGGFYYFSVKEKIHKVYPLYDSWVCEYDYTLELEYISNKEDFLLWQKYEYVLAFEEDLYCLYDGNKFVEYGTRNNDSEQHILWHYDNTSSYSPCNFIQKNILENLVPKELHPIFLKLQK